jgi:ERCC4-related helicase
VSTPYHSHYWAHALTLQRAGGTVDGLSRAVGGARVDLNPHQVDAALFALRSPLSKGVVLADEVGLGKTIEAGIVLAQRWAERKRRILLILPATLRKQWQQELEEKFSLPSVILESGTFRQARAAGNANPFEQKDRVLICSYHFAASRAQEIRRVAWALVVIDEAHRLRNVYRTSSRMAAAIRDAVSHAPKVLLTATPLQNSLMELYGLTSVIDPHLFGDAKSFRDRFTRDLGEEERNARLKERLAPVVTRTLRKQVLEYIRFTQRVPLTQDFLPTDEEQRLYDEVSEYLRREALLALPASQRALMTLVLRKLLASSTFAVAGTLRRLAQRLERMEAELSLLNDEDLDTLDELQDEWDETIDEPAGGDTGAAEIDPERLRAELGELRRYAGQAEAIAHNARGQALVSVLETAFARAAELGAARKAVIFTESRRTQQYLHALLGQNGYAGQIVLMNGVNSDPESREIYERWRERHAGTDALSRSRSADIKAALVEEFRDRGTLLIATESAAEGVNLQFCSLVVNYDLPWNPQRIEQRIGRCHRYGQKHDVVVVNFLNRRNEADQRVFELLSEKFRLFDGVFGASDEVLGALESGVDLERRIAEIYQRCRTADEIQAAFDGIQRELDDQIQARMEETRRTLLDHFDEEVQERLRVHREQALAALNTRQRWLLALTRHELAEAAEFDARQPRFRHRANGGPPARYNLDWKDAEARGETFYRLDHPLAQRLVETAKARTLPVAALRLDYAAHGALISAIEPLRGRSGWLELTKLVVDALEREEFLLLAGCTDEGRSLDEELCTKLLSIPAVEATSDGESGGAAALDSLRDVAVRTRLGEVEARNLRHFDEEVAKLDRWADDLKFGLERELREIDAAIREQRRAGAGAVSLTEKLAAQKELRTLEQKRTQKRRELYDAQDAIDTQRDELIGDIERQLRHSHVLEPLWRVRWELR